MAVFTPMAAPVAVPSGAPFRLPPEVGWAALAFFFSGISALVYQVAWQRILALHSGVGIYSVAMIVGAFLFGLGAGSHLGGALSLRLDPRGALRGFAALELGVGAFGAVSCLLYYDWLYLRAAWLYDVSWRAGLLHFLALLVPTGLMGMSLPLLTRATVWEARGSGRTIGSLYGINLLGASVGALITPWLLIRLLGIRGAVLAAVVGNLAAGVSALAIGRSLLNRRDPGPELPEVSPGSRSEEAAPAEQPFQLWVALYALSGFCALSLEIVWFRVVDVATKSSAFTFGTVLALYLFGSAVGSLIGAVRVDRLRRPLQTFLTCQCLILACSAVSVILLIRLPPDTPVYRWFFEFWGGTRPFTLGRHSNVPALLRLYLLLPAVLYALPTVLMGFAFPVLQRAVQDDPRTSGRKVGILQAANIAGCVTGSLLVGLVSLEVLGTTGTLRALLLCGLLFAGVGLRREGLRSRFGPLAALLVVLAVALPGQRALWLRLHGMAEGTAFLDEDATGVGALTAAKGRWVLWVNGKTNSSLPFGGMHTLLGAVPAVIHPAPRRIAVVGLGSGDTAAAAGCRREATESVTVFEICAPELRLLRSLASSGNPPPKLGRLLADPRFSFVVADGRNALQRGGPDYDVIETDALWPSMAYSGNLYSAEFFSLCASRLRPGGIMCSWSPSPRVNASFRRAFPHVLEMADRWLLVGSAQPFHMDVRGWTERLVAPQVMAYLGEGRALEVLETLRGARILEPAVTDGDLNHDLYPRDEFNSP